MPRQPKPPAQSIKDRVVDFRRVPASALLPNPKNFRLHNDAQRRIFREMLDRIGFAGAELTRELPDGRLMLIDGHMRQEELGDTPLPVLVTDLTEQEADALLATFDPLGRLAGTDSDAASALIESLGMAGYDAAADLLRAVADNDQTAALLESLADGMLGSDDEPDGHDVDDPSGGGDDFDTTPDESGPTRCQSGDLWQLGAHRLLCGDSTQREDVARLMDGERADMVFTDPPYGVQYRGEGGDAIEGDITYTAIPLMFSLFDDYLNGKAWLYVCGGGNNQSLYGRMFERYFRMTPRIIVWDKGRMVMRRNGYHSTYELIYFGFQEGGGARWYGSRAGEAATDIWRVPLSEQREHLTQKPIELPARAIANSCPPDGLVVDPFLGSGSTLIAAERLGRKCYGCELDTKYADVILRRWEAETGREATLLQRISEPEHATTA